MQDDRPHPPAATGRAEPPWWSPPVNEEFERYGQAYFISVNPRFMPRWLAHLDISIPGGVLGGSRGQFVRSTAFVCASVVTWCLRKSWTVSVERRDVAGAGDWRYVVHEQYRSFFDASFRRNAILDDWKDVLIPEWPSGDYAPLPFLDEVTEVRRGTTTSA